MHEPDATKYKCPNGRCIHELAAGKTADGWKDSSACQVVVVADHHKCNVFTGMRTIPPIPPWLSPRMIKILGRTHGGCGERNAMKQVPVCEPQCPKRNATCHATCPKWAEYEARRNAEYEEREKRRRGMYSSPDRLLVNAKYKYVYKQGKDVKTW